LFEGKDFPQPPTTMGFGGPKGKKAFLGVKKLAWEKGKEGAKRRERESIRNRKSSFNFTRKVNTKNPKKKFQTAKLREKPTVLTETKKAT